MKGLPTFGSKTNEPNPKVSFGDIFTMLFIGSIFLGIAFGGATLVFNGYPEKKLPDFVPPFGMLALAGGLYVFGKLLGGLSPMAEKVGMGLILGAVSIFGMFMALVVPGFSILKGMPSGNAPVFDDFSLWNWHASIPMVMSCLSTAWLGGLFSKSKRAKATWWAGGLFSFGATMSSLLISLLAFKPRLFLELDEYGIAFGFFGLVSIVALFWSKFWRPLDPVAALVSMFVPLAVAFRLFVLGTPMSLMGGGLLLAAALVFLAIGLRSIASELWIGKVSLAYSPEFPRPGDAFLLNIKFTTRKDTQLVRILSELICTEYVDGNPASDEESTSTEVCKLRLVGGFPNDIKANTPYSVQLKAILPADADPTYSGSTSYSWELQTQIILDGAPDWDDKSVIVVQK